MVGKTTFNKNISISQLMILTMVVKTPTLMDILQIVKQC